MNQEEQFIEVLSAHKGIVYKIANAYCKEYRDRQDLVQEITFQLWKSFPRYNNQYKYSTWIYRISLNIAISNYRKSNHPTRANHLDLDIKELEAVENNTPINDDLNQLHLFISELKQIDKALILLYLEEKSYKEIAEIMGLSESNIGTKISRIKLQLKEKFNTIKEK